MNLFSRLPPRNTSVSPPSSTPANSDFLNFSTDSIPSSIVPWATKLTTRTGCLWPSRCTRPIRCSSTAGFHGRSMFSTTEACCKFSPTPPASVDRNARQFGSSRKRSIRSLRFGRRNAAVEQDVLPLPARRAGAAAARAFRSHWLKTTALASGCSNSSSSSVDRLVRLLALVVFVIEQIAAVAGHAHVLQARSSAAAGRPPTGTGSAATSARCGRRSPCSRCDTPVAGPSSARRRCCRSAPAAGRAPRPCGAAAGSAPASGRCGPGRCSRPPCRPASRTWCSCSRRNVGPRR